MVCFRAHSSALLRFFHEGLIFINPGSVCYPRGQYRNRPLYFLILRKKSTFYDVTTLESLTLFQWNVLKEKNHFIKNGSNNRFRQNFLVHERTNNHTN